MKRTIWRLLNFSALLGPAIAVLVIPNELPTNVQIGAGVFGALGCIGLLYVGFRDFFDPIGNRAAPGAERYYPQKSLLGIVEVGGTRRSWGAAQVGCFLTVFGLLTWAISANPAHFADHTDGQNVGFALAWSAILTFVFATITMHFSLWRQGRSARRMMGELCMPSNANQLPPRSSG